MKDKESKRNHEFMDDSFGRSILKQFKKPKINLKKIKPYILDAFRRKEYEKLRNWMGQYLPNQKEKDDFFEQEGHSILKFIFAYFEDLNAFWFISKNFSIASIKLALKKNNYEAIQEFFVAQSGAEMFGHDDELHRKIRIEKFKILLQYAPESIEIFISENKDTSCMTIKIMEDFAKARNEEKEFDQFNSAGPPKMNL
jgi:hypothetical protein